MQQQQPKDPFKLIAVCIALVTHLVIVGVAWGSVEQRLASNERRIDVLENTLEKTVDKLNSIDKNTAVIAAWVTQQQSQPRD